MEMQWWMKQMKEDMERQVIELNQEIAKFKIRWDAQKPKEMKIKDGKYFLVLMHYT